MVVAGWCTVRPVLVGGTRCAHQICRQVHLEEENLQKNNGVDLVVQEEEMEMGMALIRPWMYVVGGESRRCRAGVVTTSSLSLQTPWGYNTMTITEQ